MGGRGVFASYKPLAENDTSYIHYKIYRNILGKSLTGFNIRATLGKTVWLSCYYQYSIFIKE